MEASDQYHAYLCEGEHLFLIFIKYSEECYDVFYARGTVGVVATVVADLTKSGQEVVSAVHPAKDHWPFVGKVIDDRRVYNRYLAPRKKCERIIKRSIVVPPDLLTQALDSENLHI